MKKRTFIASGFAAVFAAACTTTSSGSGDSAAKRSSIDASVNGALSKLYEQVPGSRK